MTFEEESALSIPRCQHTESQLYFGHNSGGIYVDSLGMLSSLSQRRDSSDWANSGGSTVGHLGMLSGI